MRAKIAKVSFAVDGDGSLVVQRGLAVDRRRSILSPSSDVKDDDVVDVGR